MFFVAAAGRAPAAQWHDGGDRVLYFDSLGAARPKVTVDVCVCTYRRPQLAQALWSVAEQRDTDDIELRVIVADNDETPSARTLAEATAAAAGLKLTYLHAPARNISVARNACLNEAQAEWIAFLDDDEIAEPLWLSRLVAAARCGGWDAVLGPVRAIYRREAKDWVRRADVHSSGAIWVRGVIQTGHTANVLIRRAAIGPLRFALAFGRTGGEDVDFFYRFYDRGGRIGFAPDAWVRDPVPQERERFGWVAVRWFRFGQTHAERVLSRAHAPADRALAVLTASAKVDSTPPPRSRPCRSKCCGPRRRSGRSCTPARSPGCSAGGWWSCTATPIPAPRPAAPSWRPRPNSPEAKIALSSRKSRSDYPGP